MSTLQKLLGAVIGPPEKVSRAKNPIQFWVAVGIGIIGLCFGVGIIYATLR